jgi:PhnB protein
MTAKSYVPPKGRVLTPYICCRDAAKAIDWYGEVFGATLTGEPYVEADGRVGHAEIEIDGGVVMLSDAYPSFGVAAPPADQLPTYALVLYVADADATVAAAERAGAAVQRAVEDMFDGSRRGTIVDPFGIRWMLGTHLRDVTEADLTAAGDDFASS